MARRKLSKRDKSGFLWLLDFLYESVLEVNKVSRYFRFLRVAILFLLLIVLLITVTFPSRLAGGCPTMFLVWALEIESDLTLITEEFDAIILKLLF